MTIRVAAWFIFLFAMSTLYSALASGPDIEFEELVYDFGEAEPEGLVSHTYVFTNTGDRDLTIARVNACCGVRGYLVTPQVTPPGGRGEIQVTYQPKGAEGVRSKTIRVHSDDPDEPVVELRVTGFVRPVLSVLPKTVLFGEVEVGEETRAEVKVLPCGGRELKFVKIESCPSWLTATVKEAPEGEEKGFTILLSLGPLVPPGQLNGLVEVEIDVGEKRLVKVPVQATVIGDMAGLRGSSGPGPDIHFVEKTYDFGVAKPGDVVTHIYKFGNIGGRELSVSRVKSCCGVSASLVSSKVIPPGGEGEIEVTFPTEGRGGKQSKTVRVHSNDADEPVVELTMTGTVQPFVSVTPGKVLFGVVPRGEERVEELEVTPMAGADKPITVKSSSQYVQAEVVETAEGGRKRFRVLVTLKAQVPCGELRESLTIEPEVGGAGSVAVPVYAKVKGNVSVVPEVLSIRGIGKGDVITRKLSVSRHDGKVLEVQRVESDLEFVSTQVSAVEEGKSYEVLVTVKAPELEKLRGGKVVIYTDDPVEGAVIVPVSFYKVRSTP